MSRSFQFFALVFSLAFAFVLQTEALTNNLALTPPMGWNDWNSYGCGISETAVTNNAGIIVAKGLKAAGYQYVDIDDGWASSRDSNGVIQAYSISTKFPHGIKWLADYVHSQGLKLGVYTDDGTNTCSSCISGATPPKDPGSFNYEYVDAFTYAQWGADYLKDDNCNATGEDGQLVYGRMSDGLMKSGRPILFCLCGGEAGNAKGYQSWSPVLGNYWRATGDIKGTFVSMISHIDSDSTSAFVAGPGRWNDPDMMEIGNGEFATNYVAAQTHFTMWCIMAAPLVMGNNLTTLSAQSLAILTNAEAIAVDQDPAGEQGIFVGGVKDSAEVWSKPLGYDFTTRAVALLNRSTNSSATITCNWTNLALQAGTATVRDLVSHQDLGIFTNSFTATIPAYGSMLLKIVGTPNPAPSSGTNYLSDRQPIYAYTGSGTIVKDKSIGGRSITNGGVFYAKGIGVNSRSGVEYDLGGVCTRFQAHIGIDDEVGSSGSVMFEVFADGVEIYNSGAMTGSTTTKTIDLDVTGVRRLTLGVDDDNDGTSNDHADWANALVIATNTPQMPEMPTGLVAGPGNAIALNWSTTLAGITYNVKRGTQTGGPYTNIANIPITTFTDSNVLSGTTYYYIVSAASSLGEGSNSVEAVAAPCNVPAAPTNVMATAGSSSVTMHWNISVGATSYNVYRFTGSTPPVRIGPNIAVTNFTDTPVAAGSTNYYLVTAANDCNQSGYSLYAAIVTPPGPLGTPTGLSATPGNALVNLNWNAANNATGYNVKRATTNGGPYTVIASNITATAYLDTTVANGTNYYYVVSALNVSGESPDSTQVSVTPAAPVTAYWTNTITTAAQNWNVNGNWTNAAAFPNSGGELTVINANITVPQTINLNQAITIGSLQIGDPDGSGNYTIAANGGSLTFSDTNTVSLTQIGSSEGDILATPVSITTNLIVVNNSINPLTLAGNLSSSGGALTIGSGTLQVGDGTTNGSLGSVNVADNAVLVFNRSDSVTNSGIISGSGSVAQIGSGILTLSGANSFSGGVTISGGTLKAGTVSALGSTSGSTVVTNGGTLDVNGNNLGAEPVFVSGWGANSNGAVVSTSSSAQDDALQHMTLTGDTAFGGPGNWLTSGNPGRWDIRGAGTTLTMSGGKPFNLYKVGNNQMSFVGVAVDTNLANIDIQQGMMGFEDGSTSMGNPAANLIVRAGATLEFYQSSAASNSYTKQFFLYGDGVTATITNWSGGGNSTISGQMTLTGVCIIGVNGTSFTNNCTITGGGGLIKGGAQPLTLGGANSYTGNTTVNGGKMILRGNGSISGSATITVNSGATLDASARSDATLTLANGQTLTGNGALNGNVIVGNGATLAPGGSIGMLTLNNNLTFNGGGMAAIELNKSLSTNDISQVGGTLTYGGTLALTNLSGALASGDSFKLFNAAAYKGAFTNITPVIPGINLAWNTNGLTNGVLAVVASPTPQPQIAGVAMSGNNFVFSGTNGVPAWTYYVLGSTNLTLPTANWMMISTGQFDPGGNFIFTNAADLDAPQMFYRLSLP